MSTAAPVKRRKRSSQSTIGAWLESEGATHPVEVEHGIGLAWYIAALLFPLIGFGGGIYWLAKGRVGPGLALLIVSGVGWFVGLTLFFMSL